MQPSKLSQYALYTAAVISAGCVIGHTQMGYDTVFPSLRTATPLEGATAAKIGWLEGNQVFAIMAILYAKWARYGIRNGYDRSILVLANGYQIACGVGFARAGIYKPLVALWLVPAVAGLSQLV